MTIKITESEIKKLVVESVQRLLEFDEGFGLYGFDEASEDDKENSVEKSNDSEPAEEHKGKGSSPEMQRKRDVVTQAFSNKEDGKSDVKRRGAIQLLYHPKTDAEWDTYRSMFSKYLDPEDTAHVWDDSEINKLFNWLSNLL